MGHNYLQMLAISKLAGRIYCVSIDGKTIKVSHAKSLILVPNDSLQLSYKKAGFFFDI